MDACNVFVQLLVPKNRHVCMQTEIPAYSYTNYAYSPPLLANVNWSTFPECFLVTIYINSWLVKWCQWRAPICSSGDLIWLLLSVHVSVSRPCSGTMALVGTCGCHSHSKLYHLCCLASLLLAFSTRYPTPWPSLPPPYIYWADVFHELIFKAIEKISQYLLARLVVQINR